jgi:hypothetical protein
MLTAAAYLIDDQGRASTIDDDSGVAGRRARACLAVSSGAAGMVVVRATVTYKGQPVKGSLPVITPGVVGPVVLRDSPARRHPGQFQFRPPGVARFVAPMLSAPPAPVGDG